MRRKFESFMGFAAFFAVFGGSAAALIGADSPEFGDICRLILGAECLLGIIIMLCVIAWFAPDSAAGKRNGQAYTKRESRAYDRDKRCLGYIKPETICNAARNYTDCKGEHK